MRKGTASAETHATTTPPTSKKRGGGADISELNRRNAEAAATKKAAKTELEKARAAHYKAENAARDPRWFPLKGDELVVNGYLVRVESTVPRIVVYSDPDSRADRWRHELSREKWRKTCATPGTKVTKRAPWNAGDRRPPGSKPFKAPEAEKKPGRYRD